MIHNFIGTLIIILPIEKNKIKSLMSESINFFFSNLHINLILTAVYLKKENLSNLASKSSLMD